MVVISTHWYTIHECSTKYLVIGEVKSGALFLYINTIVHVVLIVLFLLLLLLFLANMYLIITSGLA